MNYKKMNGGLHNLSIIYRRLKRIFFDSYRNKSKLRKEILDIQESVRYLMALKKIIYGADLNASSAYASLELLKELRLVKTRIDQTKYPARNMISLTENGKLVAEKLKDIERILEEN